MLIQMESKEFKDKDGVRDIIRFHPGLNIILGGKANENSIGKSTALLAIDFCFGGDSYYEITDVRTMLKTNDHRINFAFQFEGQIYYFSRSVINPDEVCICDEKYNQKGTQSIKEFRNFLAAKYHLQIPELTWRDAIGPYFRIYGKNNYSEKRPLDSFLGEGAKTSLPRLEKLFGYYPKITAYRAEVEKKKTERKAYETANDNQIVYTVTSKKAFTANKKTIAELEAELERLTAQEDKSISAQELDNADEAAKIKGQITYLKRKRSRLVSQRKAVQLNQEGAFNIIEGDLDELGKFFPNVNIRRITEIEEFHKRMNEILAEETEIEIARLEVLINAINDEITKMEQQLREMGIPVKLSQKFLDSFSELKRKIAYYQGQNDRYTKYKEIKDAIKNANKHLRELEEKILQEIADDINGVMRDINDEIYNGEYEAPIISFSVSSKGNSYSFRTPLDRGTGTSFKSLIVFDLSIMQLTGIPAIAHDSMLFNNIAFMPREKIMELYDKSQKQIFIAYDLAIAPTKKMQEIFDARTVLHLNKDGYELFGESWAKKTNTEIAMNDVQD